MAEAAPKRDYSGAALIFLTAAICASFIIVVPLGFPSFGFGGKGTVLLPMGVAGLSAVLSCRVLRPVARKLAAHQYFLRPFVMGCAVVVLSHFFFGLIAAPLSELFGASTRAAYGFDGARLLAKILLLGYAGFLATWLVTVPIGILAAYCVEIVGWIREDADRRKRHGPRNSDDQPKAAA